MRVKAVITDGTIGNYGCGSAVATNSTAFTVKSRSRVAADDGIGNLGRGRRSSAMNPATDVV